MAIQIDVVVVVIDRGDEMLSFIPFVGMLVGSCFNIIYYIILYYILVCIY